VVKRLYNGASAYLSGRSLPPDDPLSVAVLRAQVDVLLGFVAACRASLHGRDDAAARAELDWLERKRRDLESLRENVARGAIALPLLQAEHLRSVLLDDGQPNQVIIEAAVEDVAR